MTPSTNGRMTRHTRRQAIHAGIGLGTGMMLNQGAMRPALAQATPEASSGANDGYANAAALVDAAWVEDHRTDPSVVVVGFMPLDEFERAHIPGSAQIDYPELEVIDTSDASIADWRDEVGRLLGDLGITPDSTVVAYDEGTLFAARLWWILRYLGHENVTVLNGGMPAWRELGIEPAAGAAGPVATPVPYSGDPQPDRLAQMQEVESILDDSAVAIVDARTPQEYVDGHIPGAVNLNYPLNALPDPPKLWKPADELLAMYEEIGVTPDLYVIPYCSTGVRSAVTAFTLHLIGYEDVALYTGSWLEWGADPDTPKAEGDQA